MNTQTPQVDINPENLNLDDEGNVLNYRGEIIAAVTIHEGDDCSFIRSLEFITDLRGVLHP